MNVLAADSLNSRFVLKRDLLRELVVRDMKLRYKRSILGIGWSLLNPLAQLLVYRFIFEQVLPVKVPNFTSFLFSGVLVWNWFQMSMVFATTTVVDNRELIKRPGFPIAILPAVTITSYLIHFLLALPILLGVVLISGTKVTNSILLLPILIAIQFILTLGLVYLTATFHVAFRDTQYLLGVALQLLLFLSPIFYDVTSIPERFQLLYQINPLVSLIDAYRAVLLRGQIPDPGTLITLALITIVVVAAGYFVFTRASRHFVDEL
jgi:lipopolysaccharide transport system permease protein